MTYGSTIPFAGFYSSLHDMAFDDALEQIFSDRDTGCEVNHDLVHRAINVIDWKAAHLAYAQEFCDSFADMLGIKLKFDEMVSPREYNFTTDRIFVTMDEQTLLGLRARVDEDVLQETIRENHTSRDGFYSFYANSLEAWPADVLQWDHNQVGTLMQAVVKSEFPDYDQYQEYYLMEDSRSNGFLDGLIYPGIERLVKVHEYLDETRPNRAHN